MVVDVCPNREEHPDERSKTADDQRVIYIKEKSRAFVMNAT
jgi:hypothetical protein